MIPELAVSGPSESFTHRAIIGTATIFTGNRDEQAGVCTEIKRTSRPDYVNTRISFVYHRL